jgi:flagellar protein FliO/FliZ
MEILRSPKNKVIAASALMLVLAAAASMKGVDAASAARWILGAGAVVGAALWYRKAKATAGKFALPARLQVISRTGLSQRCGMALVEADGRTFLIVHGDGYAEVREAPPTVPIQARRSARRRIKSAPVQKAGAK